MPFSCCHLDEKAKSPPNGNLRNQPSLVYLNIKVWLILLRHLHFLPKNDSYNIHLKSLIVSWSKMTYKTYYSVDMFRTRQREASAVKILHPSALMVQKGSPGEVGPRYMSLCLRTDRCGAVAKCRWANKKMQCHLFLILLSLQRSAREQIELL